MAAREGSDRSYLSVRLVGNGTPHLFTGRVVSTDEIETILLPAARHRRVTPFFVESLIAERKAARRRHALSLVPRHRVGMRDMSSL